MKIDEEHLFDKQLMGCYSISGTDLEMIFILKKNER